MPVPTSAPVRAKRSRVAALARFRPADDPDLAAAVTDLAEEKFLAAVERALAAAPPMRPEVRDRVIGLLRTSGNNAA